jgi:hypothetical protein
MKTLTLAATAIASILIFFTSGIAADKDAKTIQLDGKIAPLAGILEKFGSRLDAEASPHWLALVTDEGKVYPLIKDDGSRLFFADPHLQNRSMRVTGRLFQDISCRSCRSIASRMGNSMRFTTGATFARFVAMSC